MNFKKKIEIGLMTPEACDVDVTRVSKEKLHPHGRHSVVDSVDDGITGFVIRVPWGRNSDTIEARILANTPTGQKGGGLINDPRPQRKEGRCN
jgi:hypothetical protein